MNCAGRRDLQSELCELRPKRSELRPEGMNYGRNGVN